MNFLNPTGLWLLLGVPVLILIYLIRSQHEDHPVSSTFIWKLSSRFMRKRLPLQRIKKLLAFVLQLLIIVGIAMLAAQPAIVSGSRCDYIAIVDASASMQTRDENGVSRFDDAITQVEAMTEKIEKGHTLSIIVAGDKATWLIQESTSVNEVMLALESVKCTNGSCNVPEALELAQALCHRSANAQVYFFTDTESSEDTNLQVVNLHRGEWNVEVTGLTAKTEGKDTLFTGTLVSYNKAAQVTVGLRVDELIIDARQVDCPQDTPVTVEFQAYELSSFDAAEVFIETQDGLALDNCYALCRKSTRTYKVLLASAHPLYLESALKALGNCEVTRTAAPKELEGYDLYVFDGVYPESYPEDGSVLIFGTGKLPDGISAGATVTEGTALTMDPKKQSPLYEGLTLLDTAVTNFNPLQVNLAWESLYFCGDHTVVATRDLGSGRQVTVAGFDLHDSNLPMQIEYLVWLQNLVEYSVPGFLKDTDHDAGTTVTLTVMPNAQEIYVELPDDEVRVLSTNAATAAVAVDQVGVYTAVMTTAEGGEYVDFFVHIPTGENACYPVSGLTLEMPLVEQLQQEDALSEIWFWVSLALLLIVLGEWGWYYHEQY